MLPPIRVEPSKQRNCIEMYERTVGQLFVKRVRSIRGHQERTVASMAPLCTIASKRPSCGKSFQLSHVAMQTKSCFFQFSWVLFPIRILKWSLRLLAKITVVFKTLFFYRQTDWMKPWNLCGSHALYARCAS